MSVPRTTSRSILAGLAAAWLVLGSAPNAHAAEGWVITSFNSAIVIAQDSTLRVTEDIRVDFGSQQKHGIFRTIPLRYRYNDAEDRFYALRLMSVTDGSGPLPHSD